MFCAAATSATEPTGERRIDATYELGKELGRYGVCRPAVRSYACMCAMAVLCAWRGRGAFAVVKKGVHRITKEKVAVKVIDKPKLRMSTGTLDVDKLLLSEVEILQKLKNQCAACSGVSRTVPRSPCCCGAPALQTHRCHEGLLQLRSILLHRVGIVRALALSLSVRCLSVCRLPPPRTQRVRRRTL